MEFEKVELHLKVEFAKTALQNSEETDLYFLMWMPQSPAALPVTDVNKVNHARAATQPTCIFTLVLTRAFIQPRTPVELAP